MCKVNIAAYDKGIMPHLNRIAAATNNNWHIPILHFYSCIYRDHWQHAKQIKFLTKHTYEA
jgi:hypothetical protein